MPDFNWEGRNARGEPARGRMEADDTDSVASQLLRMDITPIDIREVEEKRDDFAQLRRQLGLDRPGIDDLILFTRQMYTLTKSGVPLSRGLRSVAQSTHNPMLRDAVLDALEALESGRELAAGLARNPRVFSPMYISIVRVGENSGNLEGAFQQMAGYLELDRDFRARLKTAIRYPVMVIVAMVIAITILMIWVIPVFADWFARFDEQLPLPTRIIIGVSNFATNWWWLIGIVLVAAGLGIRAWLRTERGRYRWDRAKLRLPGIGPVLQDGIMARFARSFAMTSRSGVPLVQGLTLVARAVENEYVAQAVNDMRTGVERGESLSRTAAATGLFSPLVLQMLAVGEETGDVEDMMQESAEHYEREVDYALRNISAYIEPILLVFMAILVLILALGVFLPMWGLGSAALN